MMNQFIRTETVLGKDAVEKLAGARVAVFGLGGVGSYAAEALARSGIGSFLLVDHDTVALSNLNRQLIALHSSLGRKKVDVMGERILDINPRARVDLFPVYYTDEAFPHLLDSSISAAVDAIDSVTSKIGLVIRCRDAGIPLISSMGTGNKTDPEKLELADIYGTSVCPLARIMRRELKKRGVEKLPVVYSREVPVKRFSNDGDVPGGGNGKRLCPGSTAFVPAAAGLILASWVVKKIIA